MSDYDQDMDLSTLLDSSHLVVFLGGTAVGAAGKYFADLFTDQRKRREERAAKEQLFRKTRDAMAQLLAEMKEDLKRESDAYIREVVVLRNERVGFNSERPRFSYYESSHPGLKDKMGTLAVAGYIGLVSNDDDVEIYRLHEHFVARLLSDA